MSDKSLQDKAIQIQGKDYVLVSDRVIYFNKQYPNGSITTELVSDPLSDIIIVKATVRPGMIDDDILTERERDSMATRRFTGYSQAVKGAGFINKTAALENAETSAVGRALAFMGIGVIDSIASSDEINKAQGTDPALAKAKQDLLATFTVHKITDFEGQLKYIEGVLGKRTIESVEEANTVITQLNK